MADDAEEWKCPSCYKVATPKPVQIRLKRGEPWFDSSIRACPLCAHTFGGTLADRLAHIDCVYDYKYFGDYPLDDAQADAVGEAVGLAHLVPDLLEALKTLHLKAVIGTDAERHDALNAAWAAISKAEGRS